MMKANYAAGDTGVHRALIDLMADARYELVGRCELQVGGFLREAIVFTQAWPIGLPFGTDPKAVHKARRYAAVYALGDELRVVEVNGPNEH